jgi:valyl-tRNA synthetase
MIMMGLEFKKDVPFRKVVITGLIRDAEGRKMSKSLGNALDPVELIEEFGADSVRFTLLAQVAAGKDLKFSVPRLEGYRNFMNKVWNAARFSLGALADFKAPVEGVLALPKKENLSDADYWIIYKLGECQRKVDQHLKDLRFSDAANCLYDFVWHQFCDWYLELIKPVIYGNNAEDKYATQLVLAQTLNRIMRLLHPFTPYISEEIYQKLPIRSEACIMDAYPSPKTDREWLALGSKDSADELDLVIEVISAIRNIRGENRIKPADSLKVRLSPKEDKSQKILQQNKSYIIKMAKLSECEVQADGSLSKCALTPVALGDFKVDVIVYLEGIVDLDEERKRIEKAIEKFQKEISGLNSRLSNDNFVKNAPPEVVDQGRVQLTEIGRKIEALEQSLKRLN